MGGYRQLPITPFEPQQSNPLQMLAGIQQLKNAQQSNVALQQENQQRALALQDQQAMTAAMHEWDGKDINGLVPLMVKHGASANAVIGLKSKVLEQQKTYSDIAAADATTGSKNLETQKGKNDQILGGINSLKDVPDDQLAQAIPGVIQSLTQQGALAPQEAQQAGQLAQSGDPAAIRKQLDIFAKLHSTASQQMEQALKSAQTGEASSRAHEADVNANKTQQEMQLGTGPMADAKYRFLIQGQKMGRKLSPEEQAWVGAYEKQKTLVPGFTAKIMTPNLTPEAIQQLSDRFAQSGQVPNFGRFGGAATGQIVNNAAVTHAGENLVANAATTKANTQSLEAIQKNLDSVSAFENTANKNLDLFLQQAKKVIDTGSPLINAPLRSISKQMGGADQAAYEAARQVAINEIAKVTGSPGLSGQLTDSARHEVENFNPNSATLAQTYKVASVLKQDMANRHQSYQQQINDIKGRMGGGSQAQPAASGMTRIKASDGSLHDIPSANLSKAKQIDPNLQVVQ